MIVSKVRKLVLASVISVCFSVGLASTANATNLMFTPKLQAPVSPYADKTIAERESLKDFTLAYHYYDAGPNKNLKKAKFWVEQGIKKSDKDSHFLLGVMHFKGDAAKKDINLALDNLKEAAELDHKMANEMLGLIYYYGVDVPVDFHNAYIHLSEAGVGASAEAKMVLGKLLYAGDGVDKNYEEAFKYLAEAANSGHTDAQAMLSVMYRRGQGVAVNLDQSYRWLLLATEKSNDARILMGLKYEEGEGVPQDLGEAYFYYNWAKKDGSKSSQKHIERIKSKVPADVMSKQETKLRAKLAVRD